MKTIICLLLCVIFNGALMAQDNELTEEEKNAGWQLLFNGKDLSQWRNFKSQQINPQWQIVEGAMQLSGEGGGDLVSRKIFENFDLVLDWKIVSAGNSGIFILADETGKAIYSHAPEIQILDNERHADNKLDSHLSGSLYDLIASPSESHKAAEQWNHVRILLQNKHLQVWQNQVQTVDILLGSERWKVLVAKSKFATWDGFAAANKGHIGLQDHGNQVAFKNIKIKSL